MTWQEANQGGEYLRCFYVQNDEVYYFIVDDVNYFKNKDYTSSEITEKYEKYVLMWTKLLA